MTVKIKINRAHTPIVKKPKGEYQIKAPVESKADVITIISKENFISGFLKNFMLPPYIQGHVRF